MFYRTVGIRLTNINGICMTQTITDTKKTIFKVAAHLFAQKGFKGVSMREIAEQAQVSKPTVYYYFGSKEGIYRELITTGFNHVYKTMDEIYELDIPVKLKLVRITQQAFNTCLKMPDYVKVLMEFVERNDKNLLNGVLEEASEKFKVLTQLIKDGMATQEFGVSANPELAAAIINGTLRHFISMQLKTNEKILNEQLAFDIIEVLFKGLNE